MRNLPVQPSDRRVGSMIWRARLSAGFLATAVATVAASALSRLLTGRVAIMAYLLGGSAIWVVVYSMIDVRDRRRLLRQPRERRDQPHPLT